MNDNIKKVWIGALTSGQFAEGRYALRDKNDRYCALGVLCHIYGFMENVQWQFDPDYQMHHLHTKVVNGLEIPCAGFPAVDVLTWAGITTEQATRIASRSMIGISHPDIAVIIDANF